MARLLSSRDIDDVTALIVTVAADEILPRFRVLDDADVEEKSPGEMVTIADRDAEERLTTGLVGILPGALVIGEESWQHGASLIRLAGEDRPIWVIDPLDGTTAFIEGDPEFAVMVALILRGETVAAWVHAPVAGWTAVAQAGAGAFLDGEPISTFSPDDLREMSGSIRERFLPDGLRATVSAAIPCFRHVALNGSAGLDHIAVASGQRQFSLYYRTLVWDHAGGCLIVAESGGTVARLDGERYHPLDGKVGLLTAASPSVWRDVHQRLLPDDEAARMVVAEPAE